MAQKSSADGGIPRRTLCSDLQPLVGILGEVVQEAAVHDAYELEEAVRAEER